MQVIMIDVTLIETFEKCLAQKQNLFQWYTKYNLPKVLHIIHNKFHIYLHSWENYWLNFRRQVLQLIYRNLMFINDDDINRSGVVCINLKNESENIRKYVRI